MKQEGRKFEVTSTLPSDSISIGVLRERFPEMNKSSEARRVIFKKIDSLIKAEISYISAIRLCRENPQLNGILDVPRCGEDLAHALIDLRMTPELVDRIVQSLAERIRQESPQTRSL